MPSLVLAFQLLQDLARGAAHDVVVELQHGGHALLDGAVVLFLAEAEDVFPIVVHLAVRHLGIGQPMSVSFQMTPFSVNRSDSLVKAAFTDDGVAVTVGQARLVCTRKVGSESIIGKKMMSSCFLG